jgi:hypothetical protein
MGTNGNFTIPKFFAEKFGGARNCSELKIWAGTVENDTPVERSFVECGMSKVDLRDALSCYCLLQCILNV